MARISKLSFSFISSSVLINFCKAFWFFISTSQALPVAKLKMANRSHIDSFVK